MYMNISIHINNLESYVNQREKMFPGGTITYFTKKFSQNIKYSYAYLGQ